MDVNHLPFDLQGYKTAYDENIQAFCIVYVIKEKEQYKDINFVYANKAYEELSGFSLEKIIGHTYTEIIGAPSEQWNNLYGETAYSGKPKTITAPGPEIDGVVSVQCFQVAPGFCGSNVLDVTHAVEITERAKAEARKNWEHVYRERTMYQNLLDQTSTMVTVIDAQSYKVVYANEAARKVTKDIGGEYIGSTCYEIIAHGDAPCKDCILTTDDGTEERVREIAYRNRIYKMVYKIISWDGRPALMEYSEDVTEQRQVVQLAEESARLHENIIANMPTGIIVYKIENHEYKIVHANQAVCTMLGITAEEANGTVSDEILALILPEYKDVVRNAAYKMATAGEAVHYEFRTRINNTENIIWVSADGKRAIQPDGTIYIYIGYKDITEKKEKEFEFQQQVDFIANLSDEKVIAKGYHNLTKNEIIGIESFKNEGVIGSHGTPYDSLIPRLQKTAIYPKDAEKIKDVFSRENLLAEFAKGKRKFQLNYRRKKGKDKKIWASVRCSLYENPTTHDINAFLYSYDNTEKIQETQLVNRISTLEYGLLALIDVKTADITPFYRVDVDKDKLVNMQGNYNELIAKRVLKNNILGDREKLLDRMLLKSVVNGLKSRKIYFVDYSVKDSDGSHRRMRFHYSYLDESEDTVLLFTSNITENFEKEQAQIRGLQKAVYETQEATRAKSTFFSRMSHDMRTPMNGILGLSGLSKNETDVAELQRNMAKIFESGEYLLSLINDTLDVQRIESGKFNLTPQVVRVDEIVVNVLDMVKTTADAKGVNVRFEKGNTELNGYARVDSVRIKQIFVNLLSNAIKFTPAGGTVETVCRCIAREGNISHIVFTIADTGIGMSEEFIQNGIFQPFSQESNAVTSNYAGSGLGLAIVKSLVEMMGGRIEVESELSVGTKFSLYLDLERVDKEEAEQIYEMKHSQSINISTALQEKNILLAEDHPLNAEIAIKLLEKAGCHVTWTKNGQDAVEVFKNSKAFTFDAILMDIRMPIMDGLEAAKTVRSVKREDAAEIPIIAMTANAYDEDIKKSIEVGMNAHLGKPIEPDLLYQTLCIYLG